MLVVESVGNRERLSVELLPPIALVAADLS
jgi:hypothetical protein